MRPNSADNVASVWEHARTPCRPPRPLWPSSPLVAVEPNAVYFDGLTLRREGDTLVSAVLLRPAPFPAATALPAPLAMAELSASEGRSGLVRAPRRSR